MITRRKFFISSVVATAGLGIDSFVQANPLLANSIIPLERKFLENDQNYRNFLAYQGEVFLVSSLDEDLNEDENLDEPDEQYLEEQVELVDVVDTWGTDQLDQFWLRFKALPSSRLEKNVYNFEHSTAGNIRLWIEPAGSDDDGQYFEARFTLLKNFKLQNSQFDIIDLQPEDRS